MTKPTWKGIAEYVGISAIVASLVFVGFQLRQDQEIARVESFGSAIESKVNIINLITQNLDVWISGLEGEELSILEKAEFEFMAASLQDYFRYTHFRSARIGPFDPAVVIGNYAYALYVFPGLRRAYSTDQSFRRAKASARNTPNFDGQFRISVKRHLAQLDAEMPPMPTEKSYAFWVF